MNSASDLCLKISDSVCLTDNPVSFSLGVVFSIALAALLVFVVRVMVSAVAVIFENRRRKKASQQQLAIVTELLRNVAERKVSEIVEREKREQ